MLNHVYTLLMNVEGNDADALASEIVDPWFVPAEPPTALARVRSVLFGETPDRDMLGYRCRQMLAVAKATPMWDLFLAADRRVTFDFEDAIPAAAFVPVLTAAPGGDATLATIQGVATPPDASGVVHCRYSVATTGGGTVAITNLTPPFSIVVLDFDGSPLPLGDTGLSIRLQTAAAGQQYTVDVRRKPARDLAELVDAVGRLGESTLVSLFPRVEAEPNRTCHQIWLYCRELPLRVAALALSLAMRTEEARRGR